MKRSRLVLLIPALAIALTTACQGGYAASAPPNPQPSGSQTATSFQPVAGPPNCQQELQVWTDNGGVSLMGTYGVQLAALHSDITALIAAVSTGANLVATENRAYSDLNTLDDTIGALQKAMPPTCVPGLNVDLASSLGHQAQGDEDAGNGISEIELGDLHAASAALGAAGQEGITSTGDLSRASDDLAAFTEGK